MKKYLLSILLASGLLAMGLKGMEPEAPKVGLKEMPTQIKEQIILNTIKKAASVNAAERDLLAISIDKEFNNLIRNSKFQVA